MVKTLVLCLFTDRDRETSQVVGELCVQVDWKEESDMKKPQQNILLDARFTEYHRENIQQHV